MPDLPEWLTRPVPGLLGALRKSEEQKQEERLRNANVSLGAPQMAWAPSGAAGGGRLGAPADYARVAPTAPATYGGQAAPAVQPGGPNVRSGSTAFAQSLLPAIEAKINQIGQPLPGVEGETYTWDNLQAEIGGMAALGQVVALADSGGMSWVNDLHSTDPATKAMAVAESLAFASKTDIDVSKFYEGTGLTPPTAAQMFGGGGGTGARIDTNAQDAAIWERDARQAEFDNRMAQYDSKIAFDQTNVARTAQDISRHTQGLAESRQRAALITDLQVRTAPYNTGGRTSFSGTDMGALTESLMRKAGFNDPQAITNLVNYPSNVEIDAPGLMAAADAQLGVQGQLPQFGPMVAQPGQIPGAPPITAFVPTQYIGGSGAGQIPPYNPFPAGLPQQQPPQSVQQWTPPDPNDPFDSTAW